MIAILGVAYINRPPYPTSRRSENLLKPDIVSVHQKFGTKYINAIKNVLYHFWMGAVDGGQPLFVLKNKGWCCPLMTYCQ